jgi:hypothetical protein
VAAALANVPVREHRSTTWRNRNPSGSCSGYGREKRSIVEDTRRTLEYVPAYFVQYDHLEKYA